MSEVNVLLILVGIRITPRGVDELPLPAIEVRKATKSIESTKYGYLGGHKVSSKSQIMRRVSRCVKVGRKKGIGAVCRCWREKGPKVSDAGVG